MHKYSYILSLILIVMLSGCTSLSQISFDQLQPASLNFPEQIRNVAVISTVPQKNINNINIAKSEHFIGDQKMVKELLAKSIADNGYFEKVVVCDSIINYGNLSKNLSSSAVSSLLNDFDADMLISLEKIDLMVKKISGEPMGYNFDLLQCVATPEIKYYIPKKTPMFYTEKSDTLYFSLIELMDAKRMLNEACENAIFKSVDIILPHWKNITRYYYVGGSYEMRDAGVALDENNWDTAYELWKKVYDNKRGKIKSAAAYNIALYYEIKDNIPESLKWLDKASVGIKGDSKIYAIIEIYKKLLSERENRLGMLKIQMNRFSSNN